MECIYTTYTYMCYFASLAAVGKYSMQNSTDAEQQAMHADLLKLADCDQDDMKQVLQTYSVR